MPDMGPVEIIDLDTPPQATITKPVLRRSTTKFASKLLYSDDPDIAFDLEDVDPLRHKRRRLSSPDSLPELFTGNAESLEYDDVAMSSSQPTRGPRSREKEKENGSRRGSSKRASLGLTSKEMEMLEPIFFSSSPAPPRRETGRRARESSKHDEDNALHLAGDLAHGTIKQVEQRPSYGRSDTPEAADAILTEIDVNDPTRIEDRSPMPNYPYAGDPSKHRRPIRPLRLPPGTAGENGNLLDEGGTNLETASPKRARKPKASAAQKEVERAQKQSAKETEKARKAAAKEEERALKAAAKEEQVRSKARAAELAQANKQRWHHKISGPEMIVDIPPSIDSTSVGTQLRSSLEELGIEAQSWDDGGLNAIKWRRKVTVQYNEELAHWEPQPERITEEKHVLAIMKAEELVKLACAEPHEAGGETLDHHVSRLKTTLPDCTPLYLIEGYTTWKRKNKSLKNRAYTAAVRNEATTTTTASSRARRKPTPQIINEDLLEDALLRLQIHHACLIHHTTSPTDTASWIATFTQHISTIPYKTRRTPLSTSFCMDAGQVKTGADADDTYVRMLQEIVRVTPVVAYAIAAQYRDVAELVDVFRRKGPTALERLEKGGGAVGGGRVGPALSKRVYKIFMGEDPGSNDV